jgi:hypothetical protein
MIQAQIPKVSSGKIERISDFKSQFVTPRNIDVWLPENYSHLRNMQFCICRMDKCFTILISRGTNNWNVDETAELIKSKKYRIPLL